MSPQRLPTSTPACTPATRKTALIGQGIEPSLNDATLDARRRSMPSNALRICAREGAPVAPQGEAVVQLPPGLASLRPRFPDGHAAVLTVNAVLAPETP
jgi:hypothetical protein